MSDAVSKVAILSETRLQQARFATKISVTSATSATADTEAPALTGLTFTPTEIDVSAAGQQVTLSLTVTDVGTGASEITVQLNGPGGQQTAFCSATLTSGDAAWSRFPGAVNRGCGLLLPSR
jgi:hypothetical protein